MIPRKRLKLDDKKIDEKETLDFEPPSIVQHLGILPPEILVKIFEYLSPEHLVLIQYSCNSRVTEATALRKADFRDSKTASEAFMNSFFTAIRNSSLQEIYLPQMIYINSQTIFKYVSRCKFLTKLDISYIGLSYIKILRILEKCKTLKELHCYMRNTTWEEYKLMKTTHNLKKIRLNFDLLFDGVRVTEDLLSRCDTEAEVYLNFSCCTFSFNLKLTEPKRLITDFIVTIPVDEYVEGNFCPNAYFRRLMSVKFSFEDFSHQNEDYQGFCVSLSKIYSIFNKKKTSNVSSILPTTPLHTLVLTDEFSIANKELNIKFFHNLTKEASLKSLKHLTVLDKFDTSNQGYQNPEEIYRIRLSPQIVPDIFSKCSYLQEVVFTRIHFDNNCPSLYSLKHLKTLKLPPCALTPNAVRRGLPASKLKPHFLEDLVENCKYIESFSICSCCSFICLRDTLTDEDLTYIHKWSNLKHLSLTGIPKVRTCSFLPRVAADTKLTTLCLKDIGPPAVCHYGSNLCYAIRMARNLKYLQIWQVEFNPSESLFWKNIAETTTLEGLCISSDHGALINSSLITNSIEKLKRLHFFHLTAKRYPECLRKKIRKVILRNGIHNPDIEITTPLTMEDEQTCNYRHYPFIVPSYHHHL